MFFPKLRRRARWVFLALAIVFGGGFIFFGVGTGGSGIGDFVGDIFNRQPATNLPSVDAARERVQANPSDAEAQLALSQALLQGGKTDEAIAALERYRELRPRDASALRTLASLYGARSAKARDRVLRAQYAEQQTAYVATFQTGDPFQTALLTNPLTDARSRTASNRTSVALEAMRGAYRQEAAIWAELTLLEPDDPEVFFVLGEAEYNSGAAAAATAAYKQFVELAPDDYRASAVRQRLEELESIAGGGAVTGTG